jgi:hypothetical protein
MHQTQTQSAIQYSRHGVNNMKSGVVVLQAYNITLYFPFLWGGNMDVTRLEIKC